MRATPGTVNRWRKLTKSREKPTPCKTTTTQRNLQPASRLHLAWGVPVRQLAKLIDSNVTCQERKMRATRNVSSSRILKNPASSSLKRAVGLVYLHRSQHGALVEVQFTLVNRHNSRL